MKRREDERKRREWAERLARFRTSGLTVARFCASESVSVNTFYYWSSRVGAEAPASTPATPALVRFHFPAGVEVSVPADCVAAIRCLAECVRLASPAAAAAAFQEVFVGRR